MSHSTTRRHSPMLACLAALGFAGAAQAAELTLYEQPNFAGVQVTLRGYTPNVGRVGFSDRTSSVVVDSGRWEICTDSDFKGKCVILERGAYPALDPTLNDNISSAREVGSYGDSRGAYNDWGRGTIQLFSRPGFAGRNVILEADSAALSGNNFDDRASSLVVTRGTWELCADPGFSGGCRIYPPGRYAELGYGMAREASSVRLVRPTRDAPVVISPGQPVPADGTARAILYSEPGMRGQSLALSEPMNDLGRSDFDDLTASLIVESGTWIACRDTYFRGECRTFGPGRYDDNNTRNFLSRVASIRPGAGALPPPAPPEAPASPPRDTGVELFSEHNFRGDSVAVDGPIADLTRSNFNDRAESVIVHAGTWEICSDAGFNGSCAVFAPGSYARIGGLGRQVSSLRRVR